MVVRARANDTETACRLIGRNPDCAPGAGAVTEAGTDNASANRTTAKTVTAAKASGIPPSLRRPNAIGGATRSEERGGGKECRTRVSAEQYKNSAASACRTRLDGEPS